MIGFDRITDYIVSLEKSHGGLLDAMEQEARAARIPIIRKETGAFLQAMVALARPEAILEVGTAIGYSALLMAEVMPEECRITTIEKYEKRIPRARENFAAAGEEGRIELLCGDAGELLKGLSGVYDLIFMDAAKGQYLGWLPDVLRLLPEGGVLISDNMLQGGEIVQSRFAVKRRNRTIHARMREYLYELKHREDLVTSVVPVGDGAAVSVKRNTSGGNGK